MNDVNLKHKYTTSQKTKIENNEYIEELLKDALEDIKNNNVMTLEELREDVATW